MRTRSSRNKAPPVNHGSSKRRRFADPADRAAAKELKNNWGQKYIYAQCWPALRANFDKHRLRFPIGESEVTEDMVAMGIWHKDSKGRLIKSRDPVQMAQEESMAKADKKSRTTSTRGPRHDADSNWYMMTMAEREKYNEEGKARLKNELERFVEKEWTPDMARSSASTISLESKIEDLASSSASTISLQNEAEDLTSSSASTISLQGEEIGTTGLKQKQPAEPVND